jgi:hypothetical protein
MSNPIGVTIPKELQEGIRALKPVHAMSAVGRGMEKGSAYMVGEITAKRLTGKGPFPVAENKLGVVSGRLRRSFHWTGYARIEGTNASVQIGATVVYAAAHEFGFQGTVTVKAHTRKMKKGSQRIAATETTRRINYTGLGGVTSQAQKRATRSAHTRTLKGGTAKVKSHQRYLNIPERKPIRTGINENMNMMIQSIADEIVAELQRP